MKWLCVTPLEATCLISSLVCISFSSFFSIFALSLSFSFLLLALSFPWCLKLAISDTGTLAVDNDTLQRDIAIMFLYDFSFFSLFLSTPLSYPPTSGLFCGSWAYCGFSSGNLLRPWEEFCVVLILFLCVIVRCLSLVSSPFNFAFLS